MGYSTAQKLVAELLGTALLLTIVIGSGAMGFRMAGGVEGMALMANATAVGAGLYVLISMFGPISGAHFNPAVTMSFLLRQEIAPGLAAAYVGVQMIGAVLGAIAANLMFEFPWIELSLNPRAGSNLLLAEVIATFGLVGVILALLPVARERIPAGVGLYVFAGLWFTSSTCFANPAVTLGRMLTVSWTGIRPEDVLGFVGAQLLGAAMAVVLFGWLSQPGNGAGEDV